MEVEYGPTLAMVVVQVGFAGMNVVCKLAMDAGMSPLVLIAYRQVVAGVVLAPVAYLLERGSRLKISARVIFQIFLCSLFGTTLNPLLYFIGLKYSTPTIACALSNVLPALTFILAITFGLETVGIRTSAGQAKVVGTIMCVGGSMLMTFYKGSLVKMWPSHIHWKYADEMTAAGDSQASAQGMVLGAAFVLASCFAWAIWFIIQAKMSKTFSAPYTTSAIMCSMAAVQCLIVGACVERHIAKWALGWDIRLVASVYTGIIGSGLAVSVMAWCVEKRGPLFVSMFSPLLLVIVAVLGWAILDEKLYVGSVVGSMLIVGGLYMVLWGKGRDLKKVMNVGGKTVDEDAEEDGGVGAISLPMYSSPVQRMEPIVANHRDEEKF